MWFVSRFFQFEYFLHLSGFMPHKFAEGYKNPSSLFARYADKEKASDSNDAIWKANKSWVSWWKIRNFCHSNQHTSFFAEWWNQNVTSFLAEFGLYISYFAYNNSGIMRTWVLTEGKCICRSDGGLLNSRFGHPHRYRYLRPRPRPLLSSFTHSGSLPLSFTYNRAFFTLRPYFAFHLLHSTLTVREWMNSPTWYSASTPKPSSTFTPNTSSTCPSPLESSLRRKNEFVTLP